MSFIHDPKYGIIFTNGEEWRNQRRVFVSLLKNTGFRKSQLESVIEHIWPKLKEPFTTAPSVVVGITEPMQSSNGELLHTIDLALMELIVLSFADRSLFPEGHVPQRYLENINTSRTCGIQWIEQTLWYRYPILKHLAPGYSGFTWVSDMVAKTRNSLSDIISLHKKNQNRQEKSYIDAYLDEINERAREGESRQIDERTLISSLDNFILGGGDGIVAGFYSLLYCLARNPHVQENMRNEIKGNPLKGQKDKSTLPYSWAVILESLRYIPQAGFGGPHHAEEDLIVGDFKIPAGTDVYPDMIGILRSKENWEKPDTFDPMRFLDQDMKCVQPKYFIPFEIGSRTCPGRSFALDVLFMLGLKIVTELELSFDGFVDEEACGSPNELKFFGMVFIHTFSFKLSAKELTKYI